MVSKYRLADLEAFWQVAEHGGFTAAATAEERPKSSLSLAVRRLERELDIRLIERTTRRIHLTDRGHELLNEIGPLFSRLRHITAETQSRSGQISGTLRIASPYEFGAYHVAPAAEALVTEHPNLKVDIDVQYDSIADLFAKGYDVVFTMSNGVLPDSGAVSCKLFSLPRGLFAAPSFLQEQPELKTLQDLSRLPVIASPQDDAKWYFTDAARNETAIMIDNCAMRSSNADIRRQAALDGLGITRVTASFCCDAVADGRLVQVLPQYTCTPLRIYGLVNDRRLMPTKVRALFSIMSGNWKQAFQT